MISQNSIVNQSDDVRLWNLDPSYQRPWTEMRFFDRMSRLSRPLCGSLIEDIPLTIDPTCVDQPIYTQPPKTSVAKFNIRDVLIQILYVYS